MLDRDNIRADLEVTRADFHALLASIGVDHWSKRSGNPQMTVKELIWHTAWAMSWMSGSIDAVRAGKSLRLPRVLVEPGRLIAMRWLARQATPERAAQKYDQGHAALLEKLETISGDDWTYEAVRFGETRTVEWYFRHVRDHFEEHARDVKVVLPAAVVA